MGRVLRRERRFEDAAETRVMTLGMTLDLDRLSFFEIQKADAFRWFREPQRGHLEIS